MNFWVGCLLSFSFGLVVGTFMVLVVEPVYRWVRCIWFLLHGGKDGENK